MTSFCYIVSATLSLEVPSFAYFIKIQCFHKGDETFLYAHHMFFFADSGVQLLIKTTQGRCINPFGFKNVFEHYNFQAIDP